MESSTDLDLFRREAASWLAHNARFAPEDYGPIMPVDHLMHAVAWQRILYEAGYAGVEFPTQFGGAGLSPLHRSVWFEECARTAVPPVLNMVGCVLMCSALLQHGTLPQCERFIRPTLRGDMVWCQLFSEDTAGSDLASLQASAVQSGRSFIVSGRKVWTSSASASDWGLLLVRTHPTAPPHRGLSLLLVDMSLPSIAVRPIRQMTGELNFDEVLLDGAEIPVEQLVGPLHGGWAVATSTLTNERDFIAGSVASIRRRQNDLDRRLRDGDTGATSRLQFRDRLVRTHIRARVFDLYLHAHSDGSRASSALKVGMADLGIDMASLGAEMAGIAATLADSAEAKQLCAAPGGRIGGGTSEIHRNLIAERLLGLPREPHIQKSAPAGGEPEPDSEATHSEVSQP